MLHGLLWFPLLFFFIGLATAGWNEYRKVETYRIWGESFDQAKYDLYSVIGLGPDQITWGTPSRRGPENLQTLALDDIQSIAVDLDGRSLSLDQLRQQPELADQKFKTIQLAIQTAPRVQEPSEPLAEPLATRIAIRFTDIALACSWANRISQRMVTPPPV
jgi:hypothetical protein